MGKSRAEIQRDYRERKKQKEGESYLQKERNRIKGYYKPISERSSKDATKRRKQVKQWVKVHRNRVKQAKQMVEQGKSTDDVVGTSAAVHDNSQDENAVSSSTDPPRLVVKLPSFDPRNRTRKRVSRAMAKARRDINRLKEENTRLKRNYKRVSKRYERLSNSSNLNLDSTLPCQSSTEDETCDFTPQKRATVELRRQGISPRKLPRPVRNKLVFVNALCDEIQSAGNNSGVKGKQLISRVVSGKIIKKYRMKRTLGKATGFNCRTLNPTTKHCDTVPKLLRLHQQRQQLQNEIVSFLERDDNSRVMPGKSDTKMDEKIKKQKRVLNDNMSYLHLKFLSEQTTLKISLATFCRLRPKHITLTRYISKNQCLCQRHQNMALLLKAMRAAGCEVSLNPDEYVRKINDITPTEALTAVKSDTVVFEKWQKVEMADGKKRTRIVRKEIPKQEFFEYVLRQSGEFVEHVNRVKEQYKAIMTLKQNLPQGHVLVQMDFAENFSCCSPDEVQSAYWNNSSVTLHPVVDYYKHDTQLQHKSYIYISDTMNHNISTVYAILKSLVPELLKDIDHNISWIHYWTDSPSSQYRNKTSFFIISDHERLLGVPASWNFFEAGHGKGPCDGVGGTSKRMAELSVKQGKVSIQDGHDYYAWGQTYHSSAKYMFVSSAACESAREEVVEMNKKIVSVKGTMMVHAVVPISIGVIKTRTTSCYCDLCLSQNYHTDWQSTNFLQKKPKPSTDNEVTDVQENRNNLVTGSEVDENRNNKVTGSEVDENRNNEVTGSEVDENRNNEVTGSEVEMCGDKGEADTTSGNCPHQQQPEVFEEEWVAAVYQQEWYVGQVKSVDFDDGDCQITFLSSCSQNNSRKPTFKWPKISDDLWVNFQDILCKIQPPKPIGRSKRTFELHTDDLETIRDLFPKRLV